MWVEEDSTHIGGERIHPIEETDAPTLCLNPETQTLDPEPFRFTVQGSHHSRVSDVFFQCECCLLSLTFLILPLSSECGTYKIDRTRVWP